MLKSKVKKKTEGYKCQIFVLNVFILLDTLVHIYNGTFKNIFI